MGKAGFDPQTRYVLIKVGWLDRKGRKQFSTYTTSTAEQTYEIVEKEKKKKNVVSIQVGSDYVLRRN